MPSLFNIDRKTTSSLIVAVLAVCALGTSCSEEFEGERFQQTDQMSFDVSISNKWNIAKTRSAEQNGRTVTSEKIENSDLWLITTVEANPDTTLFEQPKTGTRATPYDPTGSSESLNPLDNFGVYAWVYTGEDWSNAQNKQLYINGDKVTRNGEVWDFKPSRFWPGDDYKMRFFAYAPHELTNSENTWNIGLDNGNPIINYTTAPDARNQEDLLVALDQPTKEDLENLTEVEGNYNRPLGLEFRHILTAVNVQASDALGRTITSIKFTGIKQSGTCKLENGGWIWEATDGAVEISCNGLNKDLAGSTDTPFDVINDAEGTTFMMIPQELEGAKIHVTLSDNTELSAPLTGKWEMGTRVIYKISLTEENWEYEFTVDPIDAITYEGGTTVLNITSTRALEGVGTEENVGWTAEFVLEEEEEAPGWLTLPTYGSGDPTITVNKRGENPDVAYNPHNAWFKSSGCISKGEQEAPYDLSTNGNTSSMRTANCYIINAPGYYSFPLVYGNAIDAVKNPSEGHWNTDAYSSTSKANYVLSTFVNHLNNDITSPWIADNEGCTPDHAVIVWQDAKNLTTEVTLIDKSTQEPPTSETAVKNYYIKFEVPGTSICQGNAIIAVRDANNFILWSWHIWVTDYVPSAYDKSTAPQGEKYDPDRTPQKDKLVQSRTNGRDYTFMGVPLGWCDGDRYKERTAKIKFTQDNSDKEPVIIEIKQDSYIEYGNAPFYQWGRKDPLAAGNKNRDEHSIKTFFDNTYTYSSSGLETITVGEAISNPYLYYTNWKDGPLYVNMWSSDLTDAPSAAVYNAKKTIYDPSPVGYAVPSYDAFQGFTKIGNDVNGGDVDPTTYFKSKDFNSYYTSSQNVIDNNGWVFYCYRMSGNTYHTEGGEIFFPSLGFRADNKNGDLNNLNSNDENGMYWSFHPAKTPVSQARYLDFNVRKVLPDGQTGTANAVSVRPVGEE